jgi:hypothetical protein
VVSTSDQYPCISMDANLSQEHASNLSRLQ